jgi:phospholipid/cholesterol/gamma-HCH transport system ATP-binding protein
MIEIRDIRKAFGGQPVLKGISATFEAGKTSLIMGQSGSGKTVLIKCMVGLLEPDGGEVLYNGRSYFGLGRAERKAIRTEIGFLFQGSALFDSMTVEENVMLPLSMFTSWDAQRKLARVNEVLERVGLENANAKFPAEISGGMAKRVGIARAIVQKPKYLFCDEPNSGLDPRTAGRIDALIQEITHEYGITTIINTHDMNSVMEIGEAVFFLLQGEKRWEGQKDEILGSDDPDLDRFIFASDFLQDAKYAMLKEGGREAIHRAQREEGRR